MFHSAAFRLVVYNKYEREAKQTESPHEQRRGLDQVKVSTFPVIQQRTLAVRPAIASSGQIGRRLLFIFHFFFYLQSAVKCLAVLHSSKY